MFDWIRPHLFRWVLGGTGLLGCIAGVVFTYKAHYEHPQYSYLPADQQWRDHLRSIIDLSRQNLEQLASSSAVVDISGAVDKPGVYTISSGGRVQEAILAAGGFAINADKQFIHQELNLADTVRDRAKIYVPFEGERVDQSLLEVAKDEVLKTINVNTASSSQLQQLPGIGEAKAEAIMASRPFKDKAGLVAVSGITESVLNKIEQAGYELLY